MIEVDYEWWWTACENARAAGERATVKHPGAITVEPRMMEDLLRAHQSAVSEDARKTIRLQRVDDLCQSVWTLAQLRATADGEVGPAVKRRDEAHERLLEVL